MLTCQLDRQALLAFFVRQMEAVTGGLEFTPGKVGYCCTEVGHGADARSVRAINMDCCNVPFVQLYPGNCTGVSTPGHHNDLAV